MNATAGLLAGRRIVVTRAQQQAGRLAEALRALGAEVIELPLIEIAPPASYQPLDDALRQLDLYQWLIVTSANTVRVLAARASLIPIDLSSERGLKTVAIGSATAKAMREQGINVDIVPEKYVAESVVEALKQAAPGARILLARASVARDVLPESLASLGAQVDIVDAYQTLIPAGSDARVRTLFGDPKSVPDAVTFTSSSTVKNFVALLEKAGLRVPPAKSQALSIGPVTSATLRECGWEPAIEAAQFDIDGLVTAAKQALSAS
ncbi:MAG TPA: uroporphyrinogen-III synthase [Acidisarcina sp.]|nr:uroporphyrinogen-III synthase [Acidisarcina sp.]